MTVRFAMSANLRPWRSCDAPAEHLRLPTDTSSVGSSSAKTSKIEMDAAA